MQERALLVQVIFGRSIPKDALLEFKELVSSAGAEPVLIVQCPRVSPDSKYFIGSGKAAEIKSFVQQHRIDIVIFNHSLSPSQERNLEKLLNCRVLDRTGLILDIFAQRARTFEGKLQVELAQLEHLSTRLVRGWTHLERQKGGIGLRGPGETQLETDRRLIRVRIRRLKERLNTVRKRRDQMRRKRSKHGTPTISLIGYTNAGKSSLFNSLTAGEVYMADQLFATLDPTLKQLSLPNFGNAILVDTVGFIRDLPHDLVDAFRATLEETQNADLLLMVVDCSDENYRDKIAAVNQVLFEISAHSVPQLFVMNKIDLMAEAEPRITRDTFGVPTHVWVSATQKLGMDILKAAIAESLSGYIVHCSVKLPSSEGEIRAQLYDIDSVVSEQYDESGNFLLELRLPYFKFERLLSDIKEE